MSVLMQTKKQQQQKLIAIDLHFVLLKQTKKKHFAYARHPRAHIHNEHHIQRSVSNETINKSSNEPQQQKKKTKGRDKEREEN